MRTRSCATALIVCACMAPAAAADDTISTFLGDGNSAALNRPGSVVKAPGGGYLVVDTANNRILKADAEGNASPIAGTGVGAFNGDGLAALSTKLFEPRGADVAADGAVLIADTENHRVRRVAPGFGTVTTVAGTGTEGGLLGGLVNGLLGIATELDHPSAVSALADGSFLVADTENNVIRHVSPLGTATVVAGTGAAGYAGDGGAATAAQLSAPRDVEGVDGGGFVIADTGNHVVREVAADGTIKTIAGTGTPGFSGDGAPATAAKLNSPTGIEVRPNERVFIADSGNHAIRKVGVNGNITTTAGSGAAGFAGDGTSATSARLSAPADLLRTAGASLIADTANNRVRLVGTLALTPPGDSGSVLPAPAVDALPAPTKPLELPDPVPPEVGRHLQLGPAAGSVTVMMPGTGRHIALSDAASVPVGSVIDATRGKVTLTSAADALGRTQSATFHGGAFAVGQDRGAKPVTDLAMRNGDFRPCWRREGRGGAGPARTAAKSRRTLRRLWGSGKGRFRTRGRHGAATVRGTVWLTEDSCAGTRVQVRRGLVAVRDHGRARTVMVKRGQSYLAAWRAKRR